MARSGRSTSGARRVAGQRAYRTRARSSCRAGACSRSARRRSPFQAVIRELGESRHASGDRHHRRPRSAERRGAARCPPRCSKRRVPTSCAFSGRIVWAAPAAHRAQCELCSCAGVAGQSRVHRSVRRARLRQCSIGRAWRRSASPVSSRSGNSSDVDFGDLLDYLCHDPHTRAILLYVEAITGARKFMSAARAAARNKPVIVVKAGRHAEGAKAAASHTGALAGSDDVYDAAFRRAGMLRVSTTRELFDAAETLARLKPLTGERLRNREQWRWPWSAGDRCADRRRGHTRRRCRSKRSRR